MEKEYLKFNYVNWKDEDHEYIVKVEGFTFSDYPPGEPPKHWQMHAYLLTRDGDPRNDLGDLSNRRRSFLLTKMRGIEEVMSPVTAP